MKKILTAALLAGATFFGVNTAQADDFNPLGPVRLGVMAGAGLPSPISAQAIFKYKEVVGANVEVGMLPKLTLPIGDNVSVNQQMIDVSGRLYPFKGDFFLACGLGFQRLSAEASQGDKAGASATVNTLFVSPRLGFVHKFNFGLALGMDIGAAIPFAGSLETSFSANGQTIPPPQEAIDAANFIKKTPVPILHILQLGYIF